MVNIDVLRMMALGMNIYASTVAQRARLLTVIIVGRV